MDRLSAVVATLALTCASACDNRAASETAEPRPGRVDAVLTRSNKKSWSDVCDVAPSTPSPLRWPQLDSTVPAQTDTKYRWVNVWASWCKPCVEELPLLTQTLKQWREHAQPVALTLLSVDADAASAQQFLASKPGLPTSVRLQDAATAPSWLSELGLGAGTSIPIHLVLDAQDKLLCVRAGSIASHDLDQFQKLLFPQ
jgi:thiol-disulfide isomerase/thioredoxin